MRAGFRFLGEWKGENEDFQIDAKAPVDAGVYSFIVDDVVMYVGLTQRGLAGSARWISPWVRTPENQRSGKALIQKRCPRGNE